MVVCSSIAVASGITGGGGVAAAGALNQETLQARNEELDRENTALKCRLAEMELAFQHARKTITELTGRETSLHDTDVIKEMDCVSSNLAGAADVHPSLPQPNAIKGQHSNSRRSFGSVLCPTEVGSVLAGSLQLLSGDFGVPTEPESRDCFSGNVTDASSVCQWMFRPPGGKLEFSIRIRSGPSIGAAKTDYSLPPFSIFSVSEEVQGSDGVVYLKLLDGRGWAFDSVPAVGSLCVPVSLEDVDACCLGSLCAPGSHEAKGETGRSQGNDENVTADMATSQGADCRSALSGSVREGSRVEAEASSTQEFSGPREAEESGAGLTGADKKEDGESGPTMKGEAKKDSDGHEQVSGKPIALETSCGDLRR